MKKEKIFQLTFAGLILAMNVSAQDSLKKNQLGEVVISASRSEKNINDVGRSISVITADDIKNSGANSVAELLGQQEGMYVVGAGQNPGMTASIFTRGANSNQTVILIDGVRITDPSAINNAIDVAELSLVNIEKIEIVRGSHSTLYGSSAIGGVVNIITKKSNKPGVSADAAVTCGEFGKHTQELSENIYLNYSLKNGFYASAEVLNSNVKGLNATNDTVTSTAVYKHANMSDGFSKLDWVGKAGFQNKKINIYASYKQTQQLADIDKAAYIDDDNYTVNFNRSFFTYGASYKVNEKINISYIGGLSSMKRTVIDDSSIVDAAGTFDEAYSKGVYEGRIMSNELQGNYSGKGINLVAGGGIYGEQMKENSFYFSPFFKDTISLDSIKPRSTTSTIFLHADFGGELISEKIKNASLSCGIRMSNHNIFGTNVTYEINPSLKVLEGGLLYLTYSTGYNSPSLHQLYDANRYITWDTQYTTGLTLGNKKLKPESSKTFEVGYKQNIKNMTVSAAYFNTEVDNVIEYVYLWDKNIGLDTLGQNWMRDDHRGDTYLNLGTMFTQGVELGISSKFSEKLLLSANVSLVSGKLRYKPSDIDTTQTHGNYVQIFGNGAFITNKEVETLGLSRRPNTANFSITYIPVKQFAIRADVRYVGSRGDVYYNSSYGPWGALDFAIHCNGSKRKSNILLERR
ncbi:MAG: TonB-dependent receptor [Bacteroidetes bacterium]|nr:TonB-dependent receptor [Bacteroidota bacterium]